MSNGWLAIDPYINHKPKTKKTNRVVLSKEELARLIQKEFTIERLDLVRDIFVFSCYTGLAYADARKLKVLEITLGIDGNRWIHTASKKMDTISRFPVLPVALSIMEKYSGHPQCVSKGLVLPVISNQKMNAYLKEIADLCGIHKPFILPGTLLLLR
ncbi:site-specific integrase [Mucilaginibacter sp. CSA2-8R]|uniref:site-specific integrase n=1 Tax=Mucilaginibacter sp. CSA2-8R TaxID=3141542 RepID=UPI00315D9EA7